MVPRIDMFALEVNTTIEEAIKAANDTGHSRLPVYEETIDNIIGLLYVKDLLRMGTDNGESKGIRELIREVYFVPEAKKVSELLREMQDREVHMVIVVDEYGGTAGLVTLEDIVEEIVGEIRDEYDEAEELEYEQISPDEYLLQGRLDIDDLNELMRTHLSRDDADTLGGYIYKTLGRVPIEGEQVELRAWTLKVEKVKERRVYKVRAVRKPVVVEDESTYSADGDPS
jgi:CBS domain containing-hemolysin-like protein